VDRYNTETSDALFEAMAGTIGFIDTDYQAAILQKSGS
jgi:phosphonate transport system substrate-binding protein